MSSCCQAAAHIISLMLQAFPVFSAMVDTIDLASEPSTSAAGPAGSGKVPEAGRLQKCGTTLIRVTRKTTATRACVSSVQTSLMASQKRSKSISWELALRYPEIVELIELSCNSLLNWLNWISVKLNNFCCFSPVVLVDYQCIGFSTVQDLVNSVFLLFFPVSLGYHYGLHTHACT